ncbi:sigma-54 dependent transcriptional regulator [Marinobacteraceae bacterium S3BR75-40.1]
MRPLLWLVPGTTTCALEHSFRAEGWQVHKFDSEVLPPDELSFRMTPSVGVIDLTGPELPELGTLKLWTEKLPHTLWIALLTAPPVPQSAMGQFVADNCQDYHTVPFDVGRFKAILGHLWGMALLREEMAAHGGQPEALMEGHSRAIESTRRTLRRYALASEPVLIVGESGCGKECAARYLHSHSKVRQGPFVATHCGAMPEQLVQSELFGHEKGAFTGAVARRIGRIEAAEHGSLLLDGVSEFPSSQQIVLLRFLQEGLVERLGGNAPRRVSVRIITTSRLPLEDMVSDGRFRADLYYRLAVLQVRIPPLRERLEDLPSLIDTLMKRLPPHLQSQRRPLSEAAMDCLYQYDWPGNIRELENRLRRAVVLGMTPHIQPEDLGFAVEGRRVGAARAVSLRSWRDEAERQAVSQSLEMTRYNISAAARLLQISRLSLYRLMEKYELKPEKQTTT